MSGGVSRVETFIQYLIFGGVHGTHQKVFRIGANYSRRPFARTAPFLNGSRWPCKRVNWLVPLKKKLRQDWGAIVWSDECTMYERCMDLRTRSARIREGKCV